MLRDLDTQALERLKHQWTATLATLELVAAHADGAGKSPVEDLIFAARSKLFAINLVLQTRANNRSRNRFEARFFN